MSTSALGPDRAGPEPLPLRLGCVSFLNARPLIEGLSAATGASITFDVPALLPGRLLRGDVDAALIPIVDALRHHDKLRVLSDACIGCDGETMTVRVFSQTPPDRITRLHVDTDSHTSVALAAVLWRELYGRQLILQPFDPRVQAADSLEAVLLIGDKVVNPLRGGFAYEVDLGGAWKAHTGLPFVFAVWAERSDEHREPGDDGVSAVCGPYQPLPAVLNAARDRGVARAADIARAHGPAMGWPVALAERYLCRCLMFRLTPQAVQGANLYAQRCRALGLIPDSAEIMWPVPCAQSVS